MDIIIINDNISMKIIKYFEGTDKEVVELYN